MNTGTVRLVRKSNGKSAVYLAYGKPIILPDGSKRKSESLKIDIYTVPKNNAEKRYNDKVMEIVEYVRCNRQIEIIRNQFNMGHIDRLDDSFLDYIDEKSALSQRSRYNGIKEVLKACFREEIRFRDINNGFCEEFRAYLSGLESSGRLSSNTVASYFNKFLNLVSQAYRDNILEYDYSQNVARMKWVEPVKDYLTDMEVNRLLSTSYPEKVFKRGVIFAINTGLQHSDIIDLQWSHLHNNTDGSVILSKRIVKTRYNLIVPLNKAAISVLGRRDKGQVFKGFPGNAEANRMFKEWLAKAKITKNLTFHAARHTFAMSAVSRGVDIYALKELLGHVRIENTLIYAKMRPERLIAEMRKMEDEGQKGMVLQEH